MSGNNIPNITLSSDVVIEKIEITDADITDKLTKFAESYGATGANIEELVKNPTDQLKEYAKEELKYDLAYTFIYSKREGTVAAGREDQIPEEIKHQRFEKLKQLYDSKVDENNNKYIGTYQKVLVEGESKNNSEVYQGRTSTNKVVVFDKNEKVQIGDVINIKITEAHKWYLKGE